ncbi:capsule assembly Wzi family protein, partial [Amylibacter sp.]|nr:capsule assembly Wzi family protein [Amylibacter sp.]
PWSFEIFNGFTNNNSGPKDPMILGVRTTVMPIDRLQFEFIKISQWGGEGKKNGLGAFKAAFIGNTNEKEYGNINQIAGFGFSYLLPKNTLPIRFFGQSIGEDESGNLPSCYMHLFGLEAKYNLLSKQAKSSFEIVDTRIKKTTNGNCGPITAYNNNTHKYTNYGVVMGASIDTGSKSIGLWNSFNLTNELSVNYNFEKFIINNPKWADHRLSSTRQQGWSNYVGLSWKKKKIHIEGGLHNQSINLDKNLSSNGLGMSLVSKISF